MRFALDRFIITEAGGLGTCTRDANSVRQAGSFGLLWPRGEMWSSRFSGAWWMRPGWMGSSRQSCAWAGGRPL